MATRSRLGNIVNPPKTSIPPSQPLDTRMVKNSAGGFVYQAGEWDRLLRFLILGTYGGTYYINENKLTKQNYDVLLNCLAENGQRVVDLIVEVSDAGRAQKNDFAIFALAVAASKGDDATRSAALAVLSKVCRTGTHLFQFLEDIQGFRGWGRGLRTAVRRWYNDRRYEALADQVVKYRSRNGWTHADALRKAHPKAKEGQRDALYKWIVDGEWKGELEKPKIVVGYELAKNVTAPAEAVKLIQEYGLMREALPTEISTHKDVWKALLADMKPIALIRNLGNLSKAGVLDTFSPQVAEVTGKLTDKAALKANRVHPMTLLVASKQYGAGKGHLGSNTWNVNAKVLDALQDAFELSFDAVVPTGMRILQGVDVSGSMGAAAGGNVNMTCTEACSAMALITGATEPNCHTIAFDTSVYDDIKLTKRTSLAEAQKQFRHRGGTDLAQPVIFALSKKMKVDAFIIYTDNETWAGRSHLKAQYDLYKKDVNPNVKLVVASTQANMYSVGDPADPSVLQCVGFDANLPQVISAFISGTLIEGK